MALRYSPDNNAFLRLHVWQMPRRSWPNRLNLRSHWQTTENWTQSDHLTSKSPVIINRQANPTQEKKEPRYEGIAQAQFAGLNEWETSRIFVKGDQEGRE